MKYAAGEFMEAVEDAMMEEHIGVGARQRVINRLIWGTPEGMTPPMEVDPKV